MRQLARAPHGVGPPSSWRAGGCSCGTHLRGRARRVNEQIHRLCVYGWLSACAWPSVRRPTGALLAAHCFCICIDAEQVG